jgi:hypothetical protein
MTSAPVGNAMGLMISYLLIMFIFVVPWILLLVSFWRLTKAHQSMAASLAIIAAKLSAKTEETK